RRGHTGCGRRRREDERVERDRRRHVAGAGRRARARARAAARDRACELDRVDRVEASVTGDALAGDVGALPEQAQKVLQREVVAANGRSERYDLTTGDAGGRRAGRQRFELGLRLLHVGRELPQDLRHLRVVGQRPLRLAQDDLALRRRRRRQDVLRSLELRLGGGVLRLEVAHLRALRRQEREPAERDDDEDADHCRGERAAGTELLHHCLPPTTVPWTLNVNDPSCWRAEVCSWMADSHGRSARRSRTCAVPTYDVAEPLTVKVAAGTALETDAFVAF